MLQEKKFFDVKIKPGCLSLNKRWFVECYELHYNTKIRRKFYGNINRGVTIDERLERAQILIQSLNLPVSHAGMKNNILRTALKLDGGNLRKKSISTYKTVIDNFEKFTKSINRNESSVTRKNIFQFFEWLHNKGIDKNTIPKYRNILHALFNKAIKFELCTFNPVDKVPSLRRNGVSMQYFSDAQINTLKKSIALKSPQLWLSVELLFYCFIRPGEQRFLKINDINLDYGFIEIRAEISKNKKTQKVVIPEQFLKKLQFIKNYPGNYFVIGKEGAPSPVQIGTNSLNYEHTKHLTSCKISGRYSFYSWKHTGVVKCVQSGLNIRDIQNQLRHHSLDMVQIYLQNLGVLQSEDLKKKYPAI